jgi:hypothetical protein
LEEGGAKGFHAALAHFDVALPLAALLEARIVAHEGLEASLRPTAGSLNVPSPSG